VKTAGGRELLLAGQKSGIVYALDPGRKGEIVWQVRVGKGSASGGVKWGMASDGQNVYAAVSDVVTKPAANPGGPRQLDPEKAADSPLCESPTAAGRGTRRRKLARHRAAAPRNLRHSPPSRAWSSRGPWMATSAAFPPKTVSIGRRKLAGGCATHLDWCSKAGEFLRTLSRVDKFDQGPGPLLRRSA
jgi:hypothetical protein